MMNTLNDTKKQSRHMRRLEKSVIITEEPEHYEQEMK